ncbi:MAG: hypothetical protein OYH76_00620 [Defluviicoccus sp.]|nr:hypothetical protein [Defluviicoccus sp.]MDE0274365.1 hypothetical protein [Defluviicoccus sp.]
MTEISSWFSPEIVVEIGKGVGLLLAAGVAGTFARWRYMTADAHLRQEKFHTASKLLADERSGETNPSNITRVSCITVLGRLAREDPKTYHIAVMSIFENFLTWTTVFGGDRTVVDPDAEDTREAIRFIESRNRKQLKVERKEGYKFSLRYFDPLRSPFRLKDGRMFLTDEALPLVREKIKELGIESRFLAERHPE